MRRWALRILITLSVLLVLLAVTVQIVLGTDVPRKLVIKQLESTLALRFGAKSVRTGWSGDTVLEDVTLSLPLATESFLKVKTLRVKHTNLLTLVATQNLTVKKLEFDEPELLIHQDDAGQWNVVQAAQLVARAAGGKQAADNADKKPAVTPIPEVELRGGTVRVVDRAGKTATIAPLNVSGKPESTLVWRYEVTAGPIAEPQLKVVGKLVPGGDWRHEVDLSLRNEAAWVKDWVADAKTRDMIDASHVNFAWRGAASPTGVSGLLELKDVKSGAYAVTGAFNVDVAGGVVTAKPAQVIVTGVPGTGAGVALKSGEVKYDGAGVTLADVIASVAAGDVRLNGRYGVADASANVTADWNNLQLPAGYNQHGTMTFNLTQNWTGLRQVVAKLTSAGTSPTASWDAQLALQGSGNTFNEIDWSLVAEKLRVKQGAVDANLDLLTARVVNTPRELTLTELTIPAGQLMKDRPRGTLRGLGRYQWPTDKPGGGGDWYLTLSGEKWPVFDKRDVTADFSLDASGDASTPEKDQWLRLNELYAATTSGIRVWADGQANYRGKGIPGTDLHVFMWYPPFALQGYTEDAALQGGDFRSELQISGGAWPAHLLISGSVTGTDVVIGDHPIGDVSMLMEGKAEGNDKGDYSVHLATRHFKLFEGDWDFAADYDSKSGDGLFDLKLEQLSLTAVDQFVKNPPLVGGTMSGEWKLKLPKMTMKKAEVDGDFQVVNVRAPFFAADSITGHLATNPRNVVVNKIRVLRSLGGEINASLNFAVANPTRLEAKVNVAAWPLQLPGASLLVYAQTTEPAVIDLKGKNHHAPFKLDVYPTFRNIDCGVIRTAGNVDGRVLSITSIDGETFGGKINGAASYDLDNLLNTRAQISWTDLDAVQLAALVKPPVPTTVPTATGPVTQMGELVGRISGSALVGVPTADRPLAPLVLRVDLKPKGLVYRTTAIDDATVRIYYDPGVVFGEERIVMENTEFHLAGGVAKVFARLTRHPLAASTQPASARAATQPVADWSFDALLDADKLDLNSLTHTGAKNANDSPGKVSVRTTLLGNPFDRNTWVGDGTARVTDSDLSDTGIIGGLYSIMSFKFGKRTPEGVGTADFHFEGNDLRVDRFFFTNRGVEARGNGTVHSVWTVPDSPLEGFATGTLRPLRDLKLPFAASLDKVVSLLQRNLTVVTVSGPVRDPKVQQATFAALGQGLKQFLLDDLLGGNK